MCSGTHSEGNSSQRIHTKCGRATKPGQAQFPPASPQPHLAGAHAIDGYPQSFAEPVLGVSCLEVLRELRSTKSEHSRQKLRAAGSIPAASEQSNPPL
jgi:hypothetical protein